MAGIESSVLVVVVYSMPSKPKTSAINRLSKRNIGSNPGCVPVGLDRIRNMYPALAMTLQWYVVHERISDVVGWR